MSLRALIIIATLGLVLSLSLAAPLQAAERVDLGLITVRSKQEAQNLRKRLLKGESFEALAKKHSIGAAASRGGRLGQVPVKKLRVEFREALKKLKPGQPSQVIPTENGFALIVAFAPVKKAVPLTFKKPKPLKDPGPQISKEVFSNYLAARKAVLSGAEELASGELKKADQAFSLALGLNPHEDSAHFFQEMTRTALAGKVKPQAVKSFALGFLNMIEGDSAGSLKEFSRAAQEDPGLWQAVLFEGNLLAEKGEFAKARQKMAQVLAKKPGSARAHLTLGNMARDEGDFATAQNEFTKAADKNPHLADAQYQLGALALYQSQWKDAEKHLKAALAVDPFKEEAYNDLGLVYANTQRLDQARISYLKTLELNPQFYPAHINLGTLYVQMKKFNKAIDEFEKALGINPNLGDAHVNLASVYLIKQNWRSAIAHIDKALELRYPVPGPILQALEPHRKKNQPDKP